MAWHATMFDIHLWRHLWTYYPGHAGVKGNDRADSREKHLSQASRKVGSVEELETLLVGRSEA